MSELIINEPSITGNILVIAISVLSICIFAWHIIYLYKNYFKQIKGWKKSDHHSKHKLIILASAPVLLKFMLLTGLIFGAMYIIFLMLFGDILILKYQPETQNLELYYTWSYQKRTISKNNIKNIFLKKSKRLNSVSVYIEIITKSGEIYKTEPIKDSAKIDLIKDQISSLKASIFNKNNRIGDGLLK